MIIRIIITIRDCLNTLCKGCCCVSICSRLLTQEKILESKDLLLSLQIERDMKKRPWISSWIRNMSRNFRNKILPTTTTLILPIFFFFNDFVTDSTSTSFTLEFIKEVRVKDAYKCRHNEMMMHEIRWSTQRFANNIRSWSTCIKHVDSESSRLQ